MPGQCCLAMRRMRRKLSWWSVLMISAAKPATSAGSDNRAAESGYELLRLTQSTPVLSQQARDEV